MNRLEMTASAITLEQAQSAVTRWQSRVHQAAKSGSPEAVGRAHSRLQGARRLLALVEKRVGNPEPLPKVRISSEAQQRAYAAVGLSDYPNAVLGREAAPHTDDAEQPSLGARAEPATSPTCKVHPSQPAGTCRWCAWFENSSPTTYGG